MIGNVPWYWWALALAMFAVVIGYIVHDCLEVFRARRRRPVMPFLSGPLLDRIGFQYDLRRYVGEPDEDYRARIEAYIRCPPDSRTRGLPIPTVIRNPSVTMGGSRHHSGRRYR